MRDRLITNLDDFGLYPNVDTDIVRWLDPRKISRCSVITNLSDISFLTSWIRGSGISLDVHLNATIEKPIMSMGSSFTQLVNSPRRLVFVKKIITKEIDPRKIRDRWEDQIRGFIKIFNRSPDGINSHEHLHFIPSYFKIALELSQKYNIPYIRLGEILPIIPLEYRTWILGALHRRIYTSFKESNLSTSSVLYSYDWGRLDLSQIEKKFPIDTEVILHANQKEDYRALKTL